MKAIQEVTLKVAISMYYNVEGPHSVAWIVVNAREIGLETMISARGFKTVDGAKKNVQKFMEKNNFNYVIMQG